jgi:hypothetical protein
MVCDVKIKRRTVDGDSISNLSTGTSADKIQLWSSYLEMSGPKHILDTKEF